VQYLGRDRVTGPLRFAQQLDLLVQHLAERNRLAVEGGYERTAHHDPSITRRASRRGKPGRRGRGRGLGSSSWSLTWISATACTCEPWSPTMPPCWSRPRAGNRHRRCGDLVPPDPTRCATRGRRWRRGIPRPRASSPSGSWTASDCSARSGSCPIAREASNWPTGCDPSSGAGASPHGPYRPRRCGLTAASPSAGSGWRSAPAMSRRSGSPGAPATTSKGVSPGTAASGHVRMPNTIHGTTASSGPTSAIRHPVPTAGAAYPARAGGLWLWRILVRSGFQAVVVPSGFRTRLQPRLWITIWW